MTTLTATHWAVDAPMDKHKHPSLWTQREAGVRVEGSYNGELTVYTYDDEQTGVFNVEFLQGIEPLGYTDALRVVTEAGNEHFCTRAGCGTPGTDALQCRLYDTDETVEVPVDAIETIDVSIGYARR